MQLVDRIVAPLRRPAGGVQGLAAAAPSIATVVLADRDRGPARRPGLARARFRRRRRRGRSRGHPAGRADGRLCRRSSTPTCSAWRRHPAIRPTAPATSANLTLTGTLAGREPEHGWAIIGASGQAARVYATGTALPGGAKLFAVYPDRVILDRNGSRESLMLPRLSGGAGANFAPRVASQAQGGAPNASLADSVRQLLVQNPQAGGDLLRPQPVFAGGSLRGYRVYPGRNRAQFAGLGLQPGDLVMAVNGVALDDPNRGLEILRGVGQGSAVTLTVERGGQQQQITIDPVTAMQEHAGAGRRGSGGRRDRGRGRARAGRRGRVGDRMRAGPQRNDFMTRFIRLAVLLACALPLAAAAQQGAQITPNYKDADIAQVIEAVSQVTGKSFIVDPRVRAQVTMLSTTPMSPDAFYEAFLAILQVYDYIAVPSGNVIKILPNLNARQVPANDLPDRVSATSDEIVTQVMQVRNVSAGQLVPILRPMMPQAAHLAAYPSANMLIISDRAANVNRIMRIVQRIDRSGDEDIEVIRLEHASANEIVRVINSLSSAQGADAAGGARIVADERTNSVLVSGEKSQRLRLRTLVAHLDTPLEAGGDTQVRYLRYADAEKLAAKLKEQTGAAVAAEGGPAAAQAAAAPGAVDKSITIWADPETNALVMTAPPKAMRSLMAVVDRLDVRRAQVDHRGDAGRGVDRRVPRPRRQLGRRRLGRQLPGRPLQHADRRRLARRHRARRSRTRPR